MINFYDVVIIGGGPSGLACGLMLGSATKFVSAAKEKSAIIIDSGNSDAKRAKFFNAPGVPVGISGDDLLHQTYEQLNQFNNVQFQNGEVIEIQKNDDEFHISYKDILEKKNSQIKCSKIVIATGFREFNIKGIPFKIIPFVKSTNPTRVQIEHTQYQVEKNIYVCGLISGDSSQWPIVTGSGAQVGINIISEWAGSWKVNHDK